ncbi:FAD binding domain-containing protein [Aspergillus parasiticus]|uniref:FAD binding domain-containing protein n=1 Tax=Aspergillus parasiticus TaxID=5067 RepID=A0A5N6DGV2_ASPPA|nr:FAD binding domain-containing protein [Aspergillus parasiticus]
MSETPPAKEDHVDVLIVGAGPAGLMLANWLSRFDIKTRIVDKRGTKIFNGQADGLQCRTLEIFDSFNFAHRVWRESNHMLEINFWNPDKDGILRRSDRIADTIPGISRFQQVVLHQGRIERFFLDSIKEHSDITVERGVLPTTFEFDEAKAADFEDYPITVTLRTLSEEEATPPQRQQHHRRADGTQSVINDGLFRSNLAADDTDDLIRVAKANSNASSVETVKAKFMVGCDGAHSWVRRQLGFKLEGDSTDYIWGVLDIVPITDFPDIRHRCAIHSANAGSVMVIPRENKLVRLYIQLQATEHAQSGGKADRSWITPEVILQSAQRIMHPYKINYTYCDWWTAYQIGQRVGDHFSLRERVFLAGDAVHTHSPKAGQGMNVSMQDTKDGANEGVSMEEFKNAMEKGNEFASGIVVNYGTSVIVAKEGDSAEQGDGTEVAANVQRRVVSKTHLATKIDIGKRMPSFKVLNQSDARPWHLQELLKSNGRWRIIVFPGQLTVPQNMQQMQQLGDKLGSQDSFIRQYTPPGQPIDSLIEVLTVHAGPRTGVELLDLPEVFHPFDEQMGWDYWKVYVDDQSYHEGHGQAYLNYGIDPSYGAAVIVRPDQYIVDNLKIIGHDSSHGADEEVSRIAQKAERMLKTMRLLRKLLQDSVSLIERDYVDHCQQMVGIIEAGIDNLQATVVRCWGDPHATSPTRLTMRHTAKKALYPFRQKALVSTHILNASTAAILARNLATQTNMEQSFANLEQKLDNRNLTRPVPDHRCRCVASTAVSRYHSSSCNYRRSAYSSHNAAKRFSFICTFFGLSVSASISIFKERRGFRVAPHLTFRVTVPFDSPAFVLVNKLGCGGPNSTSESAVNLVNTVIAQLYQLYDEGKARPSDIDPEGRSILHKLCLFNRNFDRFPDASAHYSQLISYFTYGNHLGEPDQGGRTPMDYLVMGDSILNQPMLMNGPYGVMGEIPAGFIGTELRKKHLVHMFEECLDVSDFAWAMLRESQFALESAVESAPNCIYTNIGYMSPLQLATAWPEGLEFLLGKGEYTIGDIYLALATAILNNTLDSVQLLFRADVPLPYWICYRQFSIDMQDLLIAEITKRRAELRDLAESVLTTNDLARFQLTKGQLPDRIAASICNLLVERGIAVPKRLTVEEYYSILGETPHLSMMKALYQAGFQDKSSLAPPQPVYPVTDLQRAMWLMDMDLNLKISKDGFPTVLELCSSITYSFLSMLRQPGPWTSLTCKHACQVVTDSFQALNKEQRQFWLGCLVSKETDSCSCSCSPGKGCGPITCVLHSLSGRGNYFMHIMIPDNRGDRHTCYDLVLLEFFLEAQGDCFESARAVLRYLTFQELGLSHTCRRSHFSGWSQSSLSDEDIAEIREEEKLSLEDLEILVSEFEHRYLERNIPLFNFLRGYWSIRMKEVLFQRKDPNFEIVEAKQIGIQLSWEPIDDFKLLFERPYLNDSQ